MLVDDNFLFGFCISSPSTLFSIGWRVAVADDAHVMADESVQRLFSMSSSSLVGPCMQFRSNVAPGIT